MSSTFNWTKQLVGTLAFSIPAGIALIDVVGYVAKVDGSSMRPALNPLDDKTAISDHVFLNTWPIANNAFDSIQRGDIVAVASPTKPKQRLIKRVIGLNGDIVKTRGEYAEPFVRIPPGHCWLEGDNHALSLDSNTFGPVPLGLIKSKAKCIVWPPSRWQMLTPPRQLPTSESYNSDTHLP